MSRVRVVEDPRSAGVPPSPEALLEALGGPAILKLPGADRSRVRAMAVLLHGNEPSGLRGLHAWLSSGARAACDVVCFVGAVDAALTRPLFSRRMAPGRRDLNRCFRPPFDGVEGEIAREALSHLTARPPEALVDLHNNTGHNPEYGVGPRLDGATLGLTALFASTFVHTGIRLGTLAEAFESVCPVVTIECGRAGEPLADEVARRGLVRYLGGEAFAGTAAAGAVSVLGSPIRVCLLPETRLAFAEAPEPSADLTVAHDIDRHNFKSVAAGTLVGWLAPGAAWPLDARGAEGEEVSREYFTLRGQRLETTRELIPIMMTTDPRAAKGDCLFYIVRGP